MELKVWPEVFKVVVVWQLVGNFNSQSNSGFVGPTSSHIPDGVTTAAKKHQWQVVFLHKLHTLGMALEGKVEATEPIS